MKTKLMWQGVTLLVLFAMLLSACAPAATPTSAPVQPTTPPIEQPTAAPVMNTEVPTTAPVPTEAATVAPVSNTPFTFGILLVGPANDSGWSQANYEGAQYAAEKTGAKLVYVDKVNTADRPGTSPSQLAESLVAQGAKLVIFSSDDMKDGVLEFTKAHPDIATIFSSGDYAWKEGKDFQNQPMLADVMPKMEFTKMIAGCAAALTTQTGKIGYVGPLINDETRRFVDSAYLGAKYCWTNYLKKNPADLTFKVTWIGFWFNIPGMTADPTTVSNDFINSGFDVLMSGLDTTEAVVEAGKASAAGKKVWAVGYDYPGNCSSAPKVCLGVPYFNWGPSYTKLVQSAIDGKFTPTFDWVPPDWKDINNKDTTGVGFVKGEALTGDASTNVDKFIAELAGGLNLWKGPLNFQDKSVFLKADAVATDQQIWYMPQLLEGMQGQSVPSK
ncbi:MAG: BMP family ABC transporter substrate-binding protein [Anaerolineaceae bacterium]|nr:BMP family ABC transporter substrate-binding protein [Anaerolineaceae bacterium]